VEITVTLKVRRGRGPFGPRDALADALRLKLLTGGPIRTSTTEWEVDEVEVHPSKAEEDEVGKVLGPMLLALERAYLDGAFDDDLSGLTVVERLLAKGVLVMETERRRQVQTKHHVKTGRPRALPEADREGDESYAAELQAWLRGAAA